MNKPQGEWSTVLTGSIERCLKPIVRMLLRLGLGASEFTAIAKAVYVDVASEEYGIRGRPTNASRVAAMTGLSRKEVAKIRTGNDDVRWPSEESKTPLNEVLHYWHTDPDFLDSCGSPQELPAEGPYSFETLVARYAGDIPAGAVRRELLGRGALSLTEGGMLKAEKRFVQANGVDEDLLGHLIFALEGLCATLSHNAQLVERISAGSPETHESQGHFERIAWTKYMTYEEIEDFRAWARSNGSRFIERADSEIGRRELPRDEWDKADKRMVGVGLYYFEISTS